MLDSYFNHPHTFPSIDGILVTASDIEIPSINYKYQLSILIMALNEAGNIEIVINDINRILKPTNINYEIIVIDGGSTDETVALAQAEGAKVIRQKQSGYAQGLLEGLAEVNGEWILTLDGDCSHEPQLIVSLLEKQKDADFIIGSRWIDGGGFSGPAIRGVLSKILNQVFKKVLSLPISDISSGYRLFKSKTLADLNSYQSKDFSILQEILVKALTEGYQFAEVPLKYKQRNQGTSHARLFSFALSYLSTLKRMWMIRNDANASDYDNRAYKSLNLVQRWWQQSRFKNITSLLGEYNNQGDVLDVGCGSSKIIQSLSHAVAFDLSLKKLRFLAKTNKLRVCGSSLDLPFKDNSFDCVIHSQLIEHLPMTDSIFSELQRIIKPNGTLIIGTVDYGSWSWPTIEKIYSILMPHAYADEHISHYTLDSLKAKIKEFGFSTIEVKTILQGEITLKAILNK